MSQSLIVVAKSTSRRLKHQSALIYKLEGKVKEQEMVIQCLTNAAYLLCHSLSLTPAPHPAPSNDGSTGESEYNYYVTAAQSNYNRATPDFAVPSIQSDCAERNHNLTRSLLLQRTILGS